MRFGALEQVANIALSNDAIGTMPCQVVFDTKGYKTALRDFMTM